MPHATVCHPAAAKMRVEHACPCKHGMQGVLHWLNLHKEMQEQVHVKQPHRLADSQIVNFAWQTQANEDMLSNPLFIFTTD